MLQGSEVGMNLFLKMKLFLGGRRREVSKFESSVSKLSGMCCFMLPGIEIQIQRVENHYAHSSKTVAIIALAQNRRNYGHSD